MPPPNLDSADSDALRKLLPLKPVDFLILLVLVDCERHGYGILRDVEEATSGDVQLDAGNLYRSLKRLMGQHLVKRLDRRPAPDSDDERRRYYGLTPLGHRAVAAEARRMQSLLLLEKARRLVAEEA